MTAKNSVHHSIPRAARPPGGFFIHLFGIFRPGKGPRCFFLRGFLCLWALLLPVLAGGQPVIPFSQEVRVAGVWDLFPYSYQEEGRITGFFPELLRSAGAVLGFTPEFPSMTWSEGLERAMEGSIDIMVSLTKTQERQAFLDYSAVPLATSWGVVLIPLESSVTDVLALDARPVGIVRGDQNGKNLMALTESFGVSPVYREYSSHSALQAAIIQGQVDAGAFFSAFRFDGDALRRSPIIYNPVQTFYAVPRGSNQRLLSELDALFTRWIEHTDSPYYQLQERYLTNQGRRPGTFPGWLRTLVILLGLGFLVVLGLNILLRRLIQRKTRELQQTNELLMAIFNHAPMPIIMMTRGGEFRYVNQRFSQVLGYSIEEIPDAETWWQIMYPREDQRRRIRQIYEHRVEQALNSGQTSIEPTEGQLVARDGRAYTFQFLMTFTQDLNVVMFQDLTELRANQQYLEDFNAQLEYLVEERTRELEQSRQALFLAEKNAGLGRMVAGFSHEVNTPIGVSLTAASFLMEETQGFSDQAGAGQVSRKQFQTYLDRALESSKIILQNLERAAGLINGFKQVSADQMHLSIRSIDLKDYLQQIMLSLQPRFRHTRHTWKIESPSIQMITYPGALAQILTNLVTNSLTYAFPDPESIGFIRITAVREDSRVFVRYEDNGVGIPIEDWEKVFEPFFTTGRGRGGTGLGLSIVHSLVTERLRGSIGLRRSELGGVCFMLDLPMELSEDTVDSDTGSAQG
ncbi:ATP-binding protein [Spirochaeta lutea]|uniref:ATP-binding protein n=1 Tax=Spirochaeta lutea TaxID=1480694 RepID=UPI00068B9249|nr:ATP-binding protein [Spirochaeta lutea]